MLYNPLFFISRLPFSHQSIQQLISMATTEERQAVLGSGTLSDVLVDQLPVATAEEPI